MYEYMHALENMKLSKNFPTELAFALATEVGLLDESECGEDFLRELKKLIQFQEIAIVCGFEESVHAYHGVDLNEDQTDALKVIHETTKPFLLGNVTSVLLDRINNTKISNKDFAESVKIILEQISESQTGSSGSIKNREKQLIVKITGEVLEE